MPYDASMDQKVFSKVWEKDGVRLSVNVYSYNKGAKKLQISRENVDEEGGGRFSKLGRLTREELEGILPLLQEAVPELD